MPLRTSTGLKNKLLGITINKCTNGSATVDISGWTPVNGVITRIASGGVSDGPYFSLAESGGANPGKMHWDFTTKVGHLYMLELYAKKGTADSCKVMVGTPAVEDVLWDSGNLADADWTLYRVFFYAISTTTRVTFQTNDATEGETSFLDELRFVSMARAVKDLFQGGFLKLYSGSQPASPDNAPSGNNVLLCTFYSDGVAAGLEFDDAAGGVLNKKTGQTWSGTAIASGTAGWFRIVVSDDSGAESTTDERIDGAVATSGAQLNMSSTAIAEGAVQIFADFSISVK